MPRVDFDSLVQQALDRIPEEFLQALSNVQILVEDWPDPRWMKEISGSSAGLAYGLFVGTPITSQQAGDWGQPPAVIYLFRGPLQTDFPHPDDLAREVEITLVHEIAHYMGFDEQTLIDYGYG